MKLKGYDNEPIDHFVDRLNFEILDYFSKLECLIDAGKITNRSADYNDFISNNWNSFEISGQTFSDKKIYLIDKLPNLTIQTRNSILLKIPQGVSVSFQGYCKEIFHFTKELTKDYEFIFFSELVNFIDYLMVYSDIVESQYVGDTKGQLLRVVNKTGEFNRTTEKIYEFGHYLRVNKSYINSINIDVRDPTGQQARFENRLSKVLVKLHFRPIRK